MTDLPLTYAPEVTEARANGAPIVALESTIITHGMPFPQNLETAQKVEAEIRAHGAVPATIADIFATRAFSLGARGIVTDGALRDTPAIADIGEPVYHFASHGATLGRKHMPFSHDEPITCAGVFVVPGDVVVGDGEGVVVIPIALVEEVVRDALVQEEKEDFALERVAAGESTLGLFPLSEERTPEFEAWRAARQSQG